MAEKVNHGLNDTDLAVNPSNSEGFEPTEGVEQLEATVQWLRTRSSSIMVDRDSSNLPALEAILDEETKSWFERLLEWFAQFFSLGGSSGTLIRWLFIIATSALVIFVLVRIIRLVFGIGSKSGLGAQSLPKWNPNQGTGLIRNSSDWFEIEIQKARDLGQWAFAHRLRWRQFLSRRQFARSLTPVEFEKQTGALSSFLVYEKMFGGGANSNDEFLEFSARLLRLEANEAHGALEGSDLNNRGGGGST